jgi:hypothetical protein
LGRVCGKKGVTIWTKLSCIAGDKLHLAGNRPVPGQQIVFANRPANGFHVRTHSTGSSGILFVESLADRVLLIVRREEIIVDPESSAW